MISATVNSGRISATVNSGRREYVLEAATSLLKLHCDYLDFTCSKAYQVGEEISYIFLTELSFDNILIVFSPFLNISLFRGFNADYIRIRA